MRKYIWMAILVIPIFGCAWYNQSKSDFSSCWDDVECRDEAIKKSEDLKSKVNALSVMSPVPGTGMVLAPIAGGLVLLFFTIAGGAKKREEDE